MKLKQIAESTIETLARGSYTTPDGELIDVESLLKRCVESTKCYKPDALELIRDEVFASPHTADRTDFELVNETTLQGAARLVASGEFQRVGVLNFASARHPGGGFLNGAKAQEESLARSSGLYPSLLRCSGYYAHHRSLKTSLYSDWMIFSPDCPILRTDTGDWLDRPYTVSILTSAAPNAGSIADNEPENLTKIPTVFRERISKVLALAAYQRCDALILGAWGCGAFRNDPALVAPLFREQLKPRGPYWGRFQKVLFSVLDTSESQNTYNAFAINFPGSF